MSIWWNQSENGFYQLHNRISSRGRKLCTHFHFLQVSLKHWISYFASLYFRPTPWLSVFPVSLEDIRGLKGSEPFPGDGTHQGLGYGAEQILRASNPCTSGWGALALALQCWYSSPFYRQKNSWERTFAWILIKKKKNSQNTTKNSALIYTLESQFDAQIHYTYLKVLKMQIQPIRDVTNS